MTELRYERREDDKLVLTDEQGDEFTLQVNEDLLNEVRVIVQQQRGISKVNPAQIQKLIRQGHTPSEVSEITGFLLTDVERFSPPVENELRHILTVAREVPVRTGAAGDTTEQFGEVIDERLASLNASNIVWKSWKDAEKGWLVAVSFTASVGEQRAVWTFDNRSKLLHPDTPEAVNLSKQGRVTEGLIPKLRAVDTSTTQNTAAPKQETLEPADQHTDATIASDTAQQEDVPDFQAGAAPDLGETQDLLEALRKRRGEREQARKKQRETVSETAHDWEATPSSIEQQPQTANTSATPELINEADLDDSWEPAGFGDGNDATEKTSPDTPNAAATAANDGDAKKKKSRLGIPSWDEILFGTRSEEDPS
ncbi:septation protein SepH [Canibacter zhoujuaniae]|uniref:septation protein SepH n=1 Tax=Canibacter zhoujuaniae TaxID=2708343 RepID=UPI00141DE0EF|nr:septation protein SepH [Canibacter zhoujuaniae]